MAEKFEQVGDITPDNLLAYKEFHFLAGECMKSTDLKLRQMATQLSDLMLVIKPGDDSAPYHRLYALAGEIHAYIEQQGFRTVNEYVRRNALVFRPDGEPDLSKFYHYIYRTPKYEPPLSQQIESLLKQSTLIHAQTKEGSFNMTLSVYQTPGGQYIVIERYTHIDSFTLEQMEQQALGSLDKGFEYAYQVYTISREQFNLAQGRLQYKIFEPSLVE